MTLQFMRHLAIIHTYIHIYIFIQDTPCQHSRLVFQGVNVRYNVCLKPSLKCLQKKRPQDHWLFVLLFTIRLPREVFFERSTSTLHLQAVHRSLQWNSYRGCIIIIIYENLLFFREPIRWQNRSMPSRVTS